MMGIRYSFLLLVLVMGTTSTATAADYTVPSGVTVLTEDQLLNQIIGNTFVGGTRWVEYYEPAAGNPKEGRIKGKDRAYGLYGGSWRIKDSLMCWEFDKASWAVYNNCYTIVLDGNKVIQYTIHGKVHTDISGSVSLTSGNPNNL